MPPPTAFRLLKIEMKQQKPGQWRGVCPACSSDASRGTLVYTDGEGFKCHGTCGGEGGDQIAFASFVLDLQGMWEGAFELAERAGIPLKPNGTVRTTSRSTGTVKSTRTVPESGRGERTQKPPPRTSREPARAERPFNPEEFWAKTAYTDEVADLGLTEDQAEDLRVGFYRGKLYQALRWPNGDIACYTPTAPGELKLPANLLPMSNVVPLQKRA